MTTGGQKQHAWDIVNAGFVTLEGADTLPYYISIVVCEDKIVVLDNMENNVQLFRLHDGQFLATTDKLESVPRDLCPMDAMTICVLHHDGVIKMLSIDSPDMSRVFKTTWSLRLQGVMDEYYGVVRFKDNIVVCGVKQGMMCWCVVSLHDGHVDAIHQICKGEGGWCWCRVTTKDNMVYIACDAGVDNTGVYGFDILNPSECKYKYKHQRLQIPTSIIINDDGNIFVCNGFHDDSCIHQLTASCHLVAIFTQGIQWRPRAMFWDNGRLYVTCLGSSDITVFTPVYQGVPLEILKMDDRSIQLFEEALKSGKENVYNIRVMVVGHVGVGKTTLIKRLLGKEVDIFERRSTEGVYVYVNCCDVSLSSFKWTPRIKDTEQDRRLQRLVNVLIDQTPTKNKTIDEEHAAILPQGVRTDNSANITDKEHVLVSSERDGTLNSYLGAHVSDEETNAEALSTGIHSLHKDFGKNIASTASQEKVSTSTAAQTTLTQSETSTMAMLKLLKENADKLKQDAVKNIPMTIWDFAGQYAFYTTHQAFLTRRAIYLLVSDISGQVTDLVDDECFFDSEGIVQCRVHDLIEVWINSIHSCSPSPESGIPPVILVGTHVDKILKKQSPAEGIESETQSMMTDTGAAARKEQSRYSSAISSMQSTSMQSTAANLNTEDVDVDDESSNGDVEGWESSHKEYDWDNGNTDDSKSMDTDDVRDKENTEDFESMDIEDTGDLESMDSEYAQKEKYCHEICERYFGKIRSYLRDKPTRFHLVNEDFAIDNTIVDRKLKDLRRKIVEVASHQTYWGEEIPAQWIPLEQELMRLKAAGIKVIPLSLFEDMNKAGTVQISKDELDLFLRFQHDIGTILYFSKEVLKMKIVLDPQWMIDALKSLITAEMFVLRNTPAVSKKWFEFKENGKLFPELIDAIWTKDNNSDLFDNRQHILLLMEQMNIIAKPKVYGEDALEVKEENYYLAPCMLRQETPQDVICPKPNPQMETSSVLCYVFTNKFLPSPIFHRLLAACAAHWPLATKKKETVQENQIFCGCCVFQLEQCHKLILHFREYVIFVRVTRMGIKEKTPSSEVCIGARVFITAMLSEIIGCLSQNLRYELFIQCPEYNGVSVNSLFPVSCLQENTEVCCDFHDNMIESFNLLKFWFKDQEQSGDIIASRVNRTKRKAKQQLLEKLSSIKRKKKRIPALKGPVAKKLSNTSQSDVPDKAEITDIKDSKKTGVSCSDPDLLCQVLKKSTQVASSSRRTLEENCQRVGLKFHGETPSNGNCFFEAVSSQLQRLNCAVQKSAQQLRQDVVAFMKANAILQVCEGTINLAEFISDDNFNDYCERMARDGEWADHVVVVGLARMLQIDIMIVTSAPSSGPENIIAWVVGQTNFNGQPILLGHIWENHYQSLQPIDHAVHEVQKSNERKQPVREETATQSNEGKQPVREETATQTEQEAEHSEDGFSAVPMPPPAAGDMDRFMRLTYLLVDVGSRILRQLLSHHTVTPTCTLDQYLAKHMSTLNNLLKRKVLHQSQMDILFPPNGGYTNLEDYDVTLLSALFNNVIPSLTQQEEDMIKSLREDRNKLYGHAKSCKMNATEYQTCWASISSTLITLSQQCGDPNFQNEISQEIQRIQVSAIPTGSYLDILTTWFSTIETVKGSLETVKESLETTEGELRALKARVGSLELMKTAGDRERK